MGRRVELSHDVIMAEQWTCPDCGREFATPNQWHSCHLTALDDHLEAASEPVRDAAVALFAVVDEIDGARIDPVKTGVTLMTDRAFGYVTVRRNSLDLQLRFEDKRDIPRARRREQVSSRVWAYEFRVEHPADVDSRLRALIREAAG